MNPGHPAPGALPFWIFVLLTSIGVARIALTYRVVAQTVDETPNIACGMEWLDQGTYNLGPFHPPLARIAMAVGPYLAGLRSQGHPDRWQEGNAILHSRGRYGKNLTLARLGILPFFILASACVWLWGRSLMGAGGALAAVFLFTNTPTVLAHSGIATTDMAATAGIVFALYRFTRWLRQPDARQSVWLGAAAGVAFLAKFSALLVVPLCALAILASRGLFQRRLPPRLRMWVLAGAVAFFVVWAGYRFSVGRFWLPAPQIADGLLQVKALNRNGHDAFLLGQVRSTGWWYFFPVVLGVKTPLAVLLLAVTGVFAVVRGPRRWELWAPALCSAAILLACMPSHLNTGLRYILCLFPMLSILAAQGVMFLWRSRAPRVAAAALLVWLTASSLRAHPDYIPYFNELGGAHPENIVVDSDLDWGQDMKRLVWKLEELRVPHVYMAVLWSGDDSRIGLPEWDSLEPYQRVKGWVAISYFDLKTRGLLEARARCRSEPAYAWLERYEPVARVGRSILLYHIPE